MSLSVQNRALIERDGGLGNNLTEEMIEEGFDIDVLNRLLDAARAEGAPAVEDAWRPISELVETVQEGFVLVWPTASRTPEVWANQTYFEALRSGRAPGWAHLFDDAQAVTHFQPVQLPSESHLASPPPTPAQGVGTQGQGDGL